jgi:hypothetical protein
MCVQHYEAQIVAAEVDEARGLVPFRQRRAAETQVRDKTAAWR